MPATETNRNENEVQLPGLRARAGPRDDKAIAAANCSDRHHILATPARQTQVTADQNAYSS
jgi:hypothetical protein